MSTGATAEMNDCAVLPTNSAQKNKAGQETRRLALVQNVVCILPIGNFVVVFGVHAMRHSTAELLRAF